MFNTKLYKFFIDNTMFMSATSTVDVDLNDKKKIPIQLTKPSKNIFDISNLYFSVQCADCVRRERDQHLDAGLSEEKSGGASRPSKARHHPESRLASARLHQLGRGGGAHHLRKSSEENENFDDKKKARNGVSIKDCDT